MKRKSKPITVGPALAVLALSATTATGQVLYVDDDAPAAGDGLAWNTAYRFLQDALAEAADSGSTINEIHVAQGVYTPNLSESNPDGYSNCCEPNGGFGCDDSACQTVVCNTLPLCCAVGWDINCANLALDLCPTLCADPRLATFQLLDGVSLMGGYAGPAEADPDVCDPALYETVLSGDLAGNDGPGAFDNNQENAYTVVTGSGTDGTAVIDGFTISGGNANGPDPGEFEWRRGGGMWNLTGSPTIRRCRFEHNHADAYGGGMYNRIFSDPLIEDCIFRGNVSGIGGGAMFNTGASLPEITGCTFELNDAAGGGGGAMFNAPDSDATIAECSFDGNTGIAGGAIYNNQSSPTISGCEFVGNAAPGAGGGAIFNNESSPTISDCSFTNNDAGEFNGGAMINLTGSQPTVTGCAFNGNTAYSGGAIRNSGNSSATIENCTFTGNTASNVGGGISNYMSDSTIRDCSFDDNTGLAGGGMYNYTASPAITRCVFTSNQTTGAGVGGGMVNSTGASPAITNCLFAGNSAAGNGGG
ncbi:MAG: right-handed parallel beta-helix repeat-containing protein, partial [Planctomycetota bacterium]